MAPSTKKKAKKVVAPAKKIVGELQLLKLLRSNSERSNQGALHVLAMEKRRALLAQIDPEGQLAKIEDEIRDTMKKYADHEAKVQEILKSIEAQFGIDIKDYNINDETGELTRIGEQN